MHFKRSMYGETLKSRHGQWLQLATIRRQVAVKTIFKFYIGKTILKSAATPPMRRAQAFSGMIRYRS